MKETDNAKCEEDRRAASTLQGVVGSGGHSGELLTVFTQAELVHLWGSAVPPLLQTQLNRGQYSQRAMSLNHLSGQSPDIYQTPTMCQALSWKLRT